MHQSPIAPFIFIDVEAAERACRLEREAFAAQWRKLKEEEETLIPNRSKKPFHKED